MSTAKKVVILNCENSADWPGFYFRLTNLPDLECDVFHCWKGPEAFPQMDRIDQYKVMIVTGSLSAAYQDFGFVPPLRAWLRAFFERPVAHGRPRVLGICFGHQILGHVLGGEAARNRAVEWTAREISLLPAFCEQPYVKAALQLARARGFLPTAADSFPSKLTVIETHGDCVKVLPPGATLLASSPATEIEAFSLGRDVLGVQFHPEFSPSVPREVILPLINSRSPLPHEQMEEWTAADFNIDAGEAAFVRAVMRSFMFDEE